MKTPKITLAIEALKSRHLNASDGNADLWKKLEEALIEIRQALNDIDGTRTILEFQKNVAGLAKDSAKKSSDNI